jgi:colicin import membrane protein
MRAKPEPGRATSALLAIFVHTLFFAFLYFGVSWQPKPQEPMMAELWKELPPVRTQPAKAEEPVKPPPPPPEPPKPQPPPKPPEPKPAPPKPIPKETRADIELKEKQRKLEQEKKQQQEAERRKQAEERKEAERRKAQDEKERREEEKRQKEEVRKQDEARKREEQARAEELRRQEEAKRREEERREDEARREQEQRVEREAEARRAAILDEQQKLAAAANERAQAEAKRREAEQAAAARAKELLSWKERIGTRIRSKVTIPPGVPESAQAEFTLTIIPGGEVLAVKLKKSSGYRAYDEAVQRAIYAAAPLPVPGDPQLFQQLRELNLVFRPN